MQRRKSFSWIRLAVIVCFAIAIGASCTPQTCTSGLAPIDGTCPVVCSDRQHQCYPDGAMIPDAPLVDASGADVSSCDGGIVCNGSCVFTSTDPNHCGACGRACPGVAHGEPTCAAGVCDFRCSIGFHVCGATCADDTSPLSCGIACTPCVAPTGATATCAGGVCGWTCNAGYGQIGDHCDVRVPRQIAPLSTSTVTSQRPTLRWELGVGSDGASVELCRDRAMTANCQTLNATGASVAPSAALTRGVWFWRLHGRVGGTTGMRTSPVWQFNVGARSAPVDTSWGSTLDVNGDGFADVAVGAPGANSNAGRVYVYMGGTGGLPTVPSVTRNAPDGAGTGFGVSVVSAGDLNGDGFDDLATGAIGAAAGAGRVYVYYGSESGLSATPATTITGPDGTMTLFGLTISDLGDVNGDGFGDFAIGAAEYQRFTGRVYVHLGSSSGLGTSASLVLTGPPGREGFGAFGMALTAADFNGDGFGDILVGTGARDVLVFDGSAGGPAAAASEVIMGAEVGFGQSIAAGDLNGDGRADMTAGLFGYNSNAGRVQIHSGGTGGLNSAPSATLDAVDGVNGQFGKYVASAWDANRDGFGDVVVIAPAYSSGTGRAYLYLGGTSGVGGAPAATITGLDGINSQFGTGLVGAGDVTADGFDDLVIGAFGASSSQGRAYVFFGFGGGLIATPAASLSGPDGANGNFGQAVALGLRGGGFQWCTRPMHPINLGSSAGIWPPFGGQSRRSELACL